MKETGTPKWLEPKEPEPPKKKRWKLDWDYLWLILFSPIIVLGIIVLGIFFIVQEIKDKFGK